MFYLFFFSVMAVMASQSHEKYSYLGIIIPLHSDGPLVGNRISRGAQGWNYVIQNWLLGFASVIHFQSQPITVRFKHTMRTFITVSSVQNTTHLCLDTLFGSPGLQGFSWCSYQELVYIYFSMVRFTVNTQCVHTCTSESALFDIQYICV